MKRTNLRKTTDYETYEILFPFRSCFGKEKHRFLYSELEKIHPCFSDDYSVDVSLKRITKNGVLLNTSVIHKCLLSKYEKHIFSGRKNITLLLVIILMCIVLSVVLITRLKSKSDMSGATVESLFYLENQGESVMDFSENRANSLRQFFEALSDGGAKITSLNWASDGLWENLSVNVQNIFPEKLQIQGEYKINFSEISYENQLPKMGVSLSVRCSGCMSSKEESDNQLQSEFSFELRELLIQNQAKIQTEFIEPYSIVFEVELFKFDFDAIKKLFCDFDVGVNVLTLNQIQNGRFVIKIGTENRFSFSDGINLDLICDYLDLFINEPVIHENVSKPELISKPESTLKNPDQSENLNLKKIGQIKNPDGIITEFYKAPDGKLIRK